eukprot:910335-Pelagomonas_calceolata.AAC.1
MKRTGMPDLVVCFRERSTILSCLCHVKDIKPAGNTGQLHVFCPSLLTLNASPSSRVNFTISFAPALLLHELKSAASQVPPKLSYLGGLRHRMGLARAHACPFRPGLGQGLGLERLLVWPTNLP